MKLLTIACVKPKIKPITNAPKTEPGPPTIMIAKAVIDMVHAIDKSKLYAKAYNKPPK